MVASAPAIVCATETGGMSVELVVAIHPPFAWLVDWASLTASGARWFLVTSAESRDRLAAEGRLGGFSAVATAEAFDVETLSRIVEPWLASASSPAAVRLATMIEPMQMPVARLRTRYGVPGPSPEQMRPFSDKLAMKAAMRGVDEYLPRYRAHDRAAFAADPDRYLAAIVAALGLPIFAKPIAENSSVGTARLDTPAALADFLRCSPYDLELDEYIEGDGFHLDALIRGGEIIWFGAGRYVAPQGLTLRGAPLAGRTMLPGEPIFHELERLNVRLIGSFAHVPDGGTHMEVLRRPDGRWVFIEVAARVSGVRVPEAHLISRGMDVRRAHYALHAGLPIEVPDTVGPYAGYYCPMKTEPGRIASILTPPFESEHRWDWAPAWRDRLDVARTMSMGDCLGFCVLWNRSLEALERDLARLEGFRPYVLEQDATFHDPSFSVNMPHGSSPKGLP
jgi:hypothetical protein